MNKIFYLLIATVLFYGCGKDVTFNSPTFQGEIENVFWRAAQYELGSADDGSLIVTGIGGGVSISLKVPDIGTANYTITGGTDIAAEYIIADASGASTLYSTIGSGEGSIKITEAGPEGFSGEFNFRAYNGIDTVSVAFGTFHRIRPNAANPQLVSESCDYVTQLANAAAVTYNATAPTADNFMDVCNAYKQALLAKIDACGDDNGAIAAEINALGDCLGANGSGTFSINANGEQKTYDIIYVRKTGSTIEVTGNIAGSNDSVYFEIDESINPDDNCNPLPPPEPVVSCGFDAIRNFNITLGGVVYNDTDPAVQYDPNDPATHPNNFTGSLTSRTLGVDQGGNQIVTGIAGTLNGQAYDNSGNAASVANGNFNITFDFQ